MFVADASGVETRLVAFLGLNSPDHHFLGYADFVGNAPPLCNLDYFLHFHLNRPLCYNSPRRVVEGSPVSLIVVHIDVPIDLPFSDLPNLCP